MRAQTFTKVAVSAGAPAEFPVVGQGGFEDPTVTAVAFPLSWMSWMMSANSAGITANGSTIAAATSAPEGTHAALLQGASNLTTTVTIQAGTWRLRFMGAQRRVGTTDDSQSVRVTVAGAKLFQQVLAPAFAVSPSSAYADYATRPFTLASATSVTVAFSGLVAGNTALIDQVRIEPVAPWNANATWGGTPPTTADSVHVPSGVAVALLGTDLAGSLLVNGELLATDQPSTLDANKVDVAGIKARFEVGHELAPFEQTFTLTLHGPAAAGQPSSKHLMAMDGGQVDLHGKPRLSWTRLTQDAAMGASQIHVQDVVTWQPSDLIVIAGTNRPVPGNVDQAEVVKVASVAANGLDITLGQPLTHAHFGGTIAPFSNGLRSWSIDERAEVGLLTRNVRVQGDLTSETSRWGAHVMLMRGPCCAPGLSGRGRFSNVEFFRMGHVAELGRYPIHFHMQLDQGAGQFVKNCAIYRSFNRAITIHGSEGVVLERNVAYDHLGHGVFLEDGSERFNKLHYNLVLGTRRPAYNEALLPTDNQHDSNQNRSPATFWITNPNNEFVGNVAAGTVGTGFWFALPAQPTGLSNPNNPANTQYFASLRPDREPLGLFVDNEVHSSGSGFDVNDSLDGAGNLLINHRWEPITSAPQYLDNFTVWGCSLALYSGADASIGAPGFEQIRFREAVLADCENFIMFADYTVLQSSCVVARSSANVQPPADLVAAYTIYDGPGRLFDSHFVGFNGSGGTYPAPLGTFHTFLNHIGAASRHANHRFRNLSFGPPGLPSMVFLDTEPDALFFGATLVYEPSPGVFAGTVIPDHPMLRTPYDQRYPFPLALPNLAHRLPFISPAKFAQLRVYHPSQTNGAISPFSAMPHVMFTRKLLFTPPPGWPVSESYTAVNDAFPWRQMVVLINAPGPENVAYDVTWHGGVPSPGPVRLEIDDMDTDLVPIGSHLTLDLVPFGTVSTLTVRVGGVVLGPVSAASLPVQPATAYAIVNNVLRLRIVSTGRSQTIELIY